MEKSYTRKTVLLRTSIKNADKMLDNLGRATELIDELRAIFSGRGENGIRIEESTDISEFDNELIDVIAEKVAEKLISKL